MPAVPFYGSLRAPLTSGVSRREGGMRDAQRARAGPARLSGLRTAGPWAGLPWEKACLRPAVRGGSPGEGGPFCLRRCAAHGPSVGRRRTRVSCSGGRVARVPKLARVCFQRGSIFRCDVFLSWSGTSFVLRSR